MKFAIYESATGAIRAMLDVPTLKVARLNKAQGEAVCSAPAGADDTTHYVDVANEMVVERKAMKPAVTTSSGQAKLSNLPDPCTIAWRSQSAEATGGEATVTFDEPGEYTLRITAEPQYLSHELTAQVP